MVWVVLHRWVQKAPQRSKVTANYQLNQHYLCNQNRQRVSGLSGIFHFYQTRVRHIKLQIVSYMCCYYSQIHTCKFGKV